MNTETTSPETNAKPELKSNGLGLAALIIGIIALVFAFIPLIQVVGGFAAFVGIVLGLVGLFLKGRKKAIAIAGTIISIVALVLSISLSAFYAQSFVDGFNAAVEESRSSAEVVPDGAEASESDGSEEPAESVASEGGTRDNPLPLGTTITIGTPNAPEWRITVGPATLDATDEVLAANQFNDEPEDGFQYAMLSLNFTYIGEDSGIPWVDLSVSFVGSDAVTYQSFDTFAVAPNPWTEINELFPDGSASGNVVIAVPRAAASDGTWRVGASFFGNDLFFAAQ